jgi:hypothetical protein
LKKTGPLARTRDSASKNLFRNSQMAAGWARKRTESPIAARSRKMRGELLGIFGVSKTPQNQCSKIVQCVSLPRKEHRVGDPSIGINTSNINRLAVRVHELCTNNPSRKGQPKSAKSQEKRAYLP